MKKRLKSDVLLSTIKCARDVNNSRCRPNMLIQGSFYEKTTLIEAIIKVLCVLSKSVRNIEPCILRNAENFTAVIVVYISSSVAIKI